MALVERGGSSLAGDGVGAGVRDRSAGVELVFVGSGLAPLGLATRLLRKSDR